MLESWLAWAARSRIPAFVEVGRRLRRNLAGIEAALVHWAVERARRVDQHQAAPLTRIAYGFKEPEHLIALALLDRGRLLPAPSRSLSPVIDPRKDAESL